MSLILSRVVPSVLQFLHFYHQSSYTSHRRLSEQFILLIRVFPLLIPYEELITLLPICEMLTFAAVTGSLITLFYDRKI